MSRPLEPGHSILIVDDTPANLRLLVDQLEEQGFQVLIAEDGESGLKRAAFTQPDLILLDICLPGIDGVEVCRRLKLDEVTREIPVIFMTVQAEEQNKVMGFDAGGVDYISKPFDLAEVCARVRTHLLLRKTELTLVEKTDNWKPSCWPGNIWSRRSSFIRRMMR